MKLLEKLISASGVSGHEEEVREAIKNEIKGLLMLPVGISTIRICPPLILTKEQANLELEILEDSIKEV